MDSIPPVDVLIISFNGATPSSYRAMTGQEFHAVRNQIRSFYPKEPATLAMFELHVLICKINQEGGTQSWIDANILKWWHDFPGRIRISYKYDNQFREDQTLDEYRSTERMYCDYLNMLNITPSGRLISCAHDFQQSTDFGNFLDDSYEEIVHNKNRVQKQDEHRNMKYTGLCEKCNYNIDDTGMVRYLK